MGSDPLIVLIACPCKQLLAILTSLINPQTKARAVSSGTGVGGIAKIETYFYRGIFFIELYFDIYSSGLITNSLGNT